MTSAVQPPGIVRSPRIRRWADVMRLSYDELERCDVAALNLACADGLPGAEDIDVEGCLKCLDDWAVGIGDLTEKGLATTFREAPEKFDHSEPLYRMYTVVVGLQRFCGVKYNPAKIGAKPTDPFDLDEQFIYGAICGPGGTCATLPILYAAIGRRLGYPIRLVRTCRHMFCRWDDPTTGVRLNIDGSHLVGMSAHPDAHYRTWPVPITAEEERLNGYLKSLSPRQELAAFTSRRGLFWHQQGNYRRAMAAELLAMALDRDTEGRAIYARLLSVEWERKLLDRRPPGFPKLEILVNPSRARWPGMPWAAEKRLRFLEAADAVLNDRVFDRQWWQPLREGRDPLVPLPASITVDCTKEELCTIQP